MFTFYILLLFDGAVQRRAKNNKNRTGCGLCLRPVRFLLDAAPDFLYSL
jgi:hypothetical protein